MGDKWPVMLYPRLPLRLLLAVVAAVQSAGCATQNSVPDSQAQEVYDSEVVLFVSPDSTAIDSLRRAMGEEDFYTAADDANYYRAQVYPLLDSLRIPYEFVDRQPLRFVVGESVATYGWNDVESPWFIVVHDGFSEPRVTYAVDYGIELARYIREN